MIYELEAILEPKRRYVQYWTAVVRHEKGELEDPESSSSSRFTSYDISGALEHLERHGIYEDILENLVATAKKEAMDKLDFDYILFLVPDQVGDEPPGNDDG